MENPRCDLYGSMNTPLLRTTVMVSVSLVVALLASLAPDHVLAECAWVLWHKQHRKMVLVERLDEAVQWDPKGASESKALCQSAQAREVRLLVARLKEAHPDGGDVDTSQADRVVQPLREGGYIEDTFICLPDSVDPPR